MSLMDSLQVRPTTYGGLELVCADHPGFGVSFPALPDPRVSFGELVDEVSKHLRAAHDSRSVTPKGRGR